MKILGNKVANIAILALMIVIFISACHKKHPHSAVPPVAKVSVFSSGDIRNLSETVKNFQDTWYTKRDFKKFREFFASDSLHFTGIIRISLSELFTVAFIETFPKSGRPFIYTSSINRADCINNYSTDRVCIIGAKDKSLVPNNEPFLYVTYSIKGYGFNSAAVLSFWVKRGNTWKIYSVIPLAG